MNYRGRYDHLDGGKLLRGYNIGVATKRRTIWNPSQAPVAKARRNIGWVCSVTEKSFSFAWRARVIHVQQMHCHWILRWIWVFAFTCWAPAKLNGANSPILRRACHGLTMDFQTSDLSEVSFSNPSQVCDWFRNLRWILAVCDWFKVSWNRPVLPIGKLLYKKEL